MCLCVWQWWVCCSSLHSLHERTICLVLFFQAGEPRCLVMMMVMRLSLTASLSWCWKLVLQLVSTLLWLNTLTVWGLLIHFEETVSLCSQFSVQHWRWIPSKVPVYSRQPWQNSRELSEPNPVCYILCNSHLGRSHPGKAVPGWLGCLFCSLPQLRPVFLVPANLLLLGYIHFNTQSANELFYSPTP